MYNDVMTTRQCAEVLGVSRTRVLVLIYAGRIKASKVGRDWHIRKADAHVLPDLNPKPLGRPRNKSKEPMSTAPTMIYNR